MEPTRNALSATAESQFSNNRFFVTSLRKMALLYLLTLGWYLAYWMYKHWKKQQFRMAKRINPPLRSVFALFFIHSLAYRVRSSWEAAHGKPWAAGWTATAAVVLALVAPVGFQLALRTPSLAPWLLPLLVLMTALPLLPLLRIQRYANLASGDPQGQGNASMTRFNLPFLILGGLIWMLVLIDSVAQFAGTA
jgi:hypothetical protein